MAIRLLSAETIDGNATFTGDVAFQGTTNTYSGVVGQHPKFTQYAGLWNTKGQANNADRYMILNAAEADGYKTYITGDEVLIRPGQNNTTGQLIIRTTGATFAGIVTTDKILVTKGQNVSHGASQLRISQEDTATSELRFYGANTSTAGTLRFLGSSSDGSVGGERMRIDSSGNFKIFAGDLTLEGGRVIVRESDDGNDAAKLTRDADEGYLQLFSSGTQTIEIRGNGNSYFNGGNVGIGTNSPVVELAINDPTGNSAIRLGGGAANNETYQIQQGIDGVSNGGFAIRNITNGSNPFVIQHSTENVGIGTDSPNQKLEVAGRIRVTTDPTLEVYEASNKRGGFQWDSTNDYVNIFSTGGDMRFDLGGERMRITSAGNVGIGTTSPDALLDIGVNNIITLDDTGSSTGFIGMGSFNDGSKNRAQGASYFGFGLEIDRPNANISFNAYASTGITTSGTNILVLKNTGNVGIGTSSPAYKLDVSGGNMAIRNSAGPQLLFFEPGRSYTDGMRLLRYQDKLSLTYGWNANEEALTVVGGTGSDVGNVGIGTTSPSAKLHVNGVVTANDSIQVQNDDSGFICRNAAGTVIGTVGAESSSTPNIGMFTVRNNGNNKIVLNSNGDSYFIGGRIGIGTTSPTEKLRVQGASGSDLLVRFQPFTNNAQTKLYLSSVSSGDGGYFYNANDNTSGLFAYGDYTFYVGTSNISGSIGNPRMIIKQDGKVGVGTTNPQNTFVVANGTDNTQNVEIAPNYIQSFNRQSGNLGYAALGFYGSSYTFNVGNVGIGTTSPGYTLEVQGQGYFSSHLYAHCLGVGAATPNSLGVIRAAGDVIAYYSSDKRLKNNITKIEKPLEKLEKINGYEFDWNDKQELYEGHDVGVVAQEIEEVYPQLVETREDGYKAVKYEKLVPLLIESIKELKKEIDNIKNKSWQSDY